jgi:hypothetical protein
MHPPAFVRSLAWGALLLALAIPLHIAGIFFGVAGARPEQGVIHVAAAVLVLAGVLLVTRRDATLVVTYQKHARWARLMAATCAAFWLVVGVFPWSRSTFWLVDYLVAAAMIAQCALALALATYCWYLALRVPDDGLAGSLYNGGCSIALISVLFAGIQALGMTDPLFLVAWSWPFPLSEIVLGVFVWCAITVWRLALNMRACAREAEAMEQQRGRPRKILKYEAKIDL